MSSPFELECFCCDNGVLQIVPCRTNSSLILTKYRCTCCAHTVMHSAVLDRFVPDPDDELTSASIDDESHQPSSDP